MKEKLKNVLGKFGVVLYYFILILIFGFPFLFITKSFWLRFILMGIELWFPILSFPISIWALIKAIQGPQDVFAISYYIYFVVINIPFFAYLVFSVLSPMKNEKQTKNKNASKKDISKKSTVVKKNLDLHNKNNIPNKFKEISCPACHERIMIDKTKEIVYCQACGKKLTKKHKNNNTKNNDVHLSIDKSEKLQAENHYKKLPATEKLAVMTVLLAEKYKLIATENPLFANDISCCDMIIFGSSIIKGCCFNFVSTTDTLSNFSNVYDKTLKNAIIKQYPAVLSFFDEMYKNRSSFLNQLYLKYSDSETKQINEIIDEFTEIIEIDLYENKYKAFDGTSSIIITGLSYNLDLQIKIKDYYKTIFKGLTPYLNYVKYELTH